MRFVCRSVLEDEGFRVIDASDGEAGLSTATEIRPDLVLCDIEMPDKNGFEVLGMFRAHPTTTAIPFVFLTGRSEKSARREGMDLGADDFLTKPFTKNELISMVNSRLQRSLAHHDETGHKLEELRQNISSAVPHELRTPLSGILGFGAILKEEAGSLSPKELSDIADHIIGSGKRLQRTLEKFWMYSEISMIGRDDKARDQLRQAMVRGAQSTIGTLAKLKARAYDRSEDLTLSLGPDACLRIGEKHFTVLLEEILDNAFKFSKKGTIVEVSLVLKESGAEISVHDRGKGMNPDDINGLGGFMQFGRKKLEQQGLGLGLAIAHELAALYGGELHIESGPEQGTRVSVQLKVC